MLNTSLHNPSVKDKVSHLFIRFSCLKGLVDHMCILLVFAVNSRKFWFDHTIDIDKSIENLTAHENIVPLLLPPYYLHNVYILVL